MHTHSCTRTHSHKRVPDSDREKHFVDSLSGPRCEQDILWPFSWICRATIVCHHPPSPPHPHTHKYTHAHTRKTSLTLLCGDESLTAPMLHSKILILLTPQGGHRSQISVRERRKAESILVPEFLPHFPSSVGGKTWAAFEL